MAIDGRIRKERRRPRITTKKEKERKRKKPKGLVTLCVMTQLVTTAYIEGQAKQMRGDGGFITKLLLFQLVVAVVVVVEDLIESERGNE